MFETAGALSSRHRIRETAKPALDRWGSGADLFGVRRRLRSLLGAGLLVIAIQLLLNPGGITGTLITLYFFLSLPIVAVAGCLLVLLRNPLNAHSVWWDNGALATVGLISLAGLVRAGGTNPAGRVLWELVSGSEHPSAEHYQFGDEDTVDLRHVRRLRRYVRYTIIGSAALILLDQVVRNDLFGSLEGGLGIAPGGPGWAVIGLVVGFALGLLFAAMDL